MLDNGRNIPTETLLTTDLAESQTRVDMSEGRLVARRGKKIETPKEKATIRLYRNKGVITAKSIFLSSNQSFHVPRVLEKAVNSSENKVPLRSKSTEGGKTCRFTHLLPPGWTGILFHCSDFYPRNWSITLRLNNPPCLDIYGNI